MKASELTGADLDRAVAICQNVEFDENNEPIWFDDDGSFASRTEYSPSTDWAQGGPIADKEKLCVGHKHQADPAYCPINDPTTNCWARTAAGGYLSYGPTPLIAAMRCYVAVKLGNEVDVPEELTK